eukprot:3456609-Rhodomonas_salina.2
MGIWTPDTQVQAWGRVGLATSLTGLVISNVKPHLVAEGRVAHDRQHGDAGTSQLADLDERLAGRNERPSSEQLDAHSVHSARPGHTLTHATVWARSWVKDVKAKVVARVRREHVSERGNRHGRRSGLEHGAIGGLKSDVLPSGVPVRSERIDQLPSGCIPIDAVSTSNCSS